MRDAGASLALPPAPCRWRLYRRLIKHPFGQEQRFRIKRAAPSRTRRRVRVLVQLDPSPDKSFVRFGAGGVIVRPRFDDDRSGRVRDNVDGVVLRVGGSAADRVFVLL